MKPTSDHFDVQPARLRLAVRGAVQGVGFRPFVYRLANELSLTGWVNNSAQGVFIEVEGVRAGLENFRARLTAEIPPRSFIQSCEATWLDAAGYDGFIIRDSENEGGKTALVLPDIATCPDCLREILDPKNRRYGYPFTNCTNCGPRFSIIKALPYDRANTSMRDFKMCRTCQAEYDNPNDRRFHAQPNACPVCGPQLELWPGTTPISTGTSPRRLARGNDALLAAAHVIRCGHIVAVKGIGGFHLLVDARNETAVNRLRERKHREEKPFALMFPTLESVKKVCEVSTLEEQLLGSPEAPIVLIKRRDDRPHPSPLPQEREKRLPLVGGRESGVGSGDERTGEMRDCYSLSPGERASIEQTSARIAQSVAPNNPYLGVMLPSNPLHHLLMAELGFPVVATSANLGDEPICTDELEALDRLQGITDVLLVHNRPIARHVDDSIVRVVAGREMVLRRARGYAPLPIQTRNGECGTRNILAVGAHLKNSVALAVGEQVFLSQHIGDLETERANDAFRRVAAELPEIYETSPEVIAADLHPEYLSAQFADEIGGRAGSPLRAVGAQQSASPAIVHVQHHEAHALACLAENEVELPALAVAWDGTGLGSDGTIWGGEFFFVTDEVVERIARLRPFHLPGGDAAVKQPRRAALGLLFELLGEEAFQRSDIRSIPALTDAEQATLRTMLQRKLNSPLCSSVGRLFDAVASLTGLRHSMRFEGQAAMELEFALEGARTEEAYGLPLITRHSPMMLDWSPVMEGVMVDVNRGVPTAKISAKFHNALAESIVAVAREFGLDRVALSGGCFQNRYLTERAVKRLREEGFQPYWHQRVPTNDGGIALGQVVAARRWSHAEAARDAKETLPDLKPSRPLRPLCEV